MNTRPIKPSARLGAALLAATAIRSLWLRIPPHHRDGIGALAIAITLITVALLVDDRPL